MTIRQTLVERLGQVLRHDYNEELLDLKDLSATFDKSNGEYQDYEDGVDIEDATPFGKSDSSFREMLQKQVRGSDSLRNKIRVVLEEFESVFGDADQHHHCTVDAMSIELVDGAVLFASKARTMAPKLRAICKEQINELVQKGFLVPVTSASCTSPILMARQKDKYRLCVDFKRLNDITVRDMAPIPRIDETISRLKGIKIFGSLDLASGYHQMRLDKKAQNLTTIVTSEGMFQFTRVPFGLCNAPGWFQGVMSRVLSKCLDRACRVYIDDIVIFGVNEDQFVAHLREVLGHLRANNLRIKTKK